MRATARKVPGVATFYGMVIADGRPVWICSHSHPTRRRANACARTHIKHLPRSGPAALRLLRQSWKPQEVSVPTDPDDGRPIFSRSHVEAFLQCVQFRDDHSPEAAYGTAVHDAVHMYWQLCIATHEESRLGDVDRIVRDAFFRSEGNDPERYEEARSLVYEFVSSRLLDAGQLLVVDRLPAIEFSLRADNGWCWLTGRVDRLNRTDGEDPDDAPRIIRVKDYKSGWQPTGGARLDGAPSNGSTRVIPHEFQRRFYACLAFNDPRINPRGELEAVETEIEFMRYHGEPEVITYERGELDAWWEDVRWALAQRWQDRKAPPTGCNSCQFCADRITCGAATTEARAIPTDLEQARHLASDWIRTTARAKGQRAALLGFMQERDPIVVGGLEVGFLRPRKATWKASKPLEIVTHLNAAGMAGDQVLFTAVDPRKVPDVLKAPMVEAGIARWEPGAPEFKARKAGADDGD